MESLIKKIKFYFVMRKANKELTDAILEAERMFRTNNTRYFVIPDYKHKLRVFSWGQLQKMKNQGLFSANCKESDFIRECFFYTPSKIDKTYMLPETKEKKRKMWLAYFKAYRIE